MKIKNSKIFMIAILALLATSGAFAQNQNWTQRIQVLHHASFSEGGSNVGGSDDQIRVTNEWCDDVADSLKQFETVAIGKWADGSPALSIELYKQGLSQIMERATDSPSSRLTWVYRIAERELQLADRLSAASASYDFQRDVLQHSYELITNQYSALDRRYYRSNATAFESNLRRHGLTQLSWFEKKMLVLKNDGSVAPAFGDQVFYMTLANLAKGISDDMTADSQNPSLFPARYATAAKKLKRLSANMESILSGNGASNGERTVQSAYREMKDIQSDLNQ
jgi:hypothetical protein